MANPTKEDTPRKKGKASSVVVWILMAMLVLGLGGFGLTNFGGSVTAIGSVGDREISTDDYARALHQELNAVSAQFGTNITMQQARALGLDARVRQQLISTAALDNEAQRIGISAGDKRIADEITATPNFRGTSGQFDREAYRYTLERNNLTESAYETRLREDLARSLLQGAVTGGFVSPAMLTETLYAYISEQRDFSMLRLGPADLTAPAPEPTEAGLKTYYDENIAEFTRPEARRITYAAVLPEDIADKMDMDEQALRALYTQRIGEFVQPERRLVERLVYPTEAEATAARARLDAGASFEALVKDRGVTLADIDLGDVSKNDLGAAGEAVFALKDPAVVGPFDSDLGPALFRMNAILDGHNISFEEARPDLAAEQATDAARRAIGDMVEDLDDRLAGGATLEDLAKETDMTLGQIDMTADSAEGMAAYPNFRKAANEVAEGDFPEIKTLDDGGVFALRLDEIIPPAPIPFEEAKDAVTASWRQAAETKALSERAIEIKSAVEGGAALGNFGVAEVTPSVTRSSTLENTPPSLIKELFTMEEGQTRVFDDGGLVALLHLDRITPGAAEGPDAEALKAALAAQGEQAISQDAFLMFTNALIAEAGISLDDTAINAVHAQFP